jgi:hypothetical protein
MAKTVKIPQDKLEAYFDSMTKRFLRPDPSRQAAEIEIMSSDLGDQTPVSNAHLIGITYDRHENALELALESEDHRIFHPDEVWVVEEPDGFVSAIEVVRPDGVREVVTVKHVAIVPRS